MLILFVLSHFTVMIVATRLNFLAAPSRENVLYHDLLTHYVELNRTETKVLQVPLDQHVDKFVLLDLPLFFEQRYIVSTFSACSRNASLFYYTPMAQTNRMQRIKVLSENRIYALDANCLTKDRYGSCQVMVDYVFGMTQGNIARIQYCRHNIDTSEESCQMVPWNDEATARNLPDIVVLHNSILSLVVKERNRLHITIWPISTLVQYYFSRTFQNLRTWRSESEPRYLDIYIKKRLFACAYDIRLQQVKTTLIEPNLIILAMLCEQNGHAKKVRYVEYHQTDLTKTAVRVLPIGRHLSRLARQHARRVAISSIKQTPYTVQYLFADGAFYDKRTRSFVQSLVTNNYTNVINDFIR